MKEMEEAINAICDLHPVCNPIQPTSWSGVYAAKSAESRQRWTPIFNQLKPFGTLEALAGRIPVDIFDLISNSIALRSTLALGLQDGLEDQLVLWYPGEAIAVPLRTIERDYRAYDKAVIDAARKEMAL